MRSRRLESVFWGILFGAIAIVMLVDRLTPKPTGIDDASADRRASIPEVSEDAQRSTTIEVVDAVDGRPVVNAQLSIAWPARPGGVVPLEGGAATLEFPWAAEGRAQISISADGYFDLRRSISAEDLRACDRHLFRLFKTSDVVTLVADIEVPDGIRVDTARTYVVPPRVERGDWRDAAIDEHAEIDGPIGGVVRVTAQRLRIDGGALLAIAANGTRNGGPPESIVARFEIERAADAFSVAAPFRADRRIMRATEGALHLGKVHFSPPAVEGTVVDDRGRPLEGVTVAFHEMLRAKTELFGERGFGSSALDRADVVTDRSGRFAFSYDTAGIRPSADSGPAGRIDLWRPPNPGATALRAFGQKVVWGRRERHVLPATEPSESADDGDSVIGVRR